MNTATKIVDIGKDFTRFPAGRTPSDGPYSGAKFRDVHLRPALDRKEHIVVRLDSALGYGSSFLEEAFGGLVRQGYSKEMLRELIQLDTKDPLLRSEILGYIEQAKRNDD